MQLEKANEAVTGLRKVVQDLIAPELGSIKATQAAHGEQFTLIRTEIKVSEERTKEAIAALGDRLIERIEFARRESQDANTALSDRLIEKVEFARSEAQHSANEIKLFIGINYEQRKREEAEARVAELERRLQLQPPS